MIITGECPCTVSVLRNGSGVCLQLLSPIGDCVIVALSAPSHCGGTGLQCHCRLHLSLASTNCNLAAPHQLCLLWPLQHCFQCMSHELQAEVQQLSLTQGQWPGHGGLYRFIVVIPLRGLLGCLRGGCSGVHQVQGL